MPWLAQVGDLTQAADLIGGTVLGAVVLLLIFGWLWAKPAVDSLKEENRRLVLLLEKKDEEVVALRTSITEKVVPIIEHNTHVADRTVVMLEKRADLDRAMMEHMERHT